MAIPDYQKLWDTAEVHEEARPLVHLTADKISQGKSRYQEVASFYGMPWEVVGVIHCLECSLRWMCHLHNGDPLSGRTIHVPRGRPAAGEPPFTWEESARDALLLQRAGERKWDLPGALGFLERYNGIGYFRRGIHTPYLWSMTNHYVCGKFISDGKFSPTAVSRQVGAAPLLMALGWKG